MAKRNIKFKKGFTIIEVVLVLAIAGLIFLMVFVALPALQRSQRDTQRRDDMARVATAITQYQTNNNGSLPTDGTSLITNYLGGAEFVDPDGGAYHIVVTGPKANIDDKLTGGTLSFDNTNHNIYLVHKASCSGEKVVRNSSTSQDRDYAIVYKLEGSGTYCADNK